jgi:hypothetical protein
MSPRHHFAEYAKRDPKGYQTFSDSMWNTFVSVTHHVGLSKYFSYTPEESQRRVYKPEDGQFPDNDVK